jgi:hypothetical protein
VDWGRRSQEVSCTIDADKLVYTVILSFNYVDTSQSSTTLLRGPNQTSRASTTNQTLAKRAAQLDAEESSGQPSIWRDVWEVYNLMRCPGPPCDLGPYCWCDPDGKKRYKLNTHHLRSLIRYVEQGHELRMHCDVPKHIRDQLHAEDQQSLGGTKEPIAPLPQIFLLLISRMYYPDSHIRHLL